MISTDKQTLQTDILNNINKIFEIFQSKPSKLEEEDYLKVITKMLILSIDLRIDMWGLKIFNREMCNRYQEIRFQLVEKSEARQEHSELWDLLSEKLADYLNISASDIDMLLSLGV